MVEATGSEPRKGKIQRHGCVDFNFGNPKYPGDNWWSMINVSFELIFIYQCYKLHHLGSFAYFDQIASKHQNGEQLHAMCWDTKGDTTSSMILRSQGADRRSQITNDNSQGWVSQRWFIFGILPKLACYCRFFCLPSLREFLGPEFSHILSLWKIQVFMISYRIVYSPRANANDQLVWWLERSCKASFSPLQPSFPFS